MPTLGLTIGLDEFRRVLYYLPTAECKQFVKRVLGLPWDPAGELTVGNQLRILVADWIEHLHVFSDAQRDDVVRRLDHQFQEWAVLLAECADAPGKPVITLAIHDYNWVSCSGRDRFYDIAEMEDAEEMPREAITHASCDVTALYLRARARVAQLRKAGRKEVPDGRDSGRSARQASGDPPALSLSDFADGKPFPKGGRKGTSSD